MIGKNLKKELGNIISKYNSIVKKIDKKAKKSHERAYGGFVRATKGQLVESIARDIVRLSWKELGQDNNRLVFGHHTIEIPIKKEYITKIKNKEVREYLIKNINKIHYRIKPDVQVYVDDEFKIAIERKAYSENAMLKRILVDFTLIKHIYPQAKFVLLQLESQLGGDYSNISKDVHFGSPQTHTLLSYFDVDINIITLLEGERKVDKPIHKKEFFKPLKMESLINAFNIIKSLLND